MKFALPLILLISACAQMKGHVTKGSSKEAKVQMDSADVVWSDLEKLEDDDTETHALVDTVASNDQISAAVGGDPDQAEEVEESRSQRPFLKKIKTKRVKFWVNYFTEKQRDRFQRFLNNGMMYRPIIEKILDEEGLPRELFFVGLIESGYYLGAHSHASAVGPWQFIRGTAHRYGLVMNRDLDERRDIFKATQAAAQYFKDLNNIFSSWELALAAYNSGEYGMIRRITKYKTRDYYQLSRNKQIPAETINYVPKVLAAMYVVENAAKYGFKLPQENARFWQKTKTITAPKGTNLSTLSKRLGLSSTLLVKLNPELRSKRTPRTFPGSYQLRIPADKHTAWMETLVAEEPQVSPRVKELEVLRDRVLNPERHVAAVAKVAPKKMAPRVHRVKRGETLSLIAARNNMTLKQIALMNDMTVKSKIRIGQIIKLHKDDEVKVRTAASKRVVKVQTKPLVYKLQRGETLTDVARWFNTSVDALKSANNITKGRQLHVGHKVKIPATRRGTYTVRPGDYLIKIAQKFGLNQTALMKLNNLKRQSLYAGQRLVVNLE
ncbi:MAG: LysM peptidoglycan-binding domain-containing protein [Bacteriovoracia bacterium]